MKNGRNFVAVCNCVHECSLHFGPRDIESASTGFPLWVVCSETINSYVDARALS